MTAAEFATFNDQLFDILYRNMQILFGYFNATGIKFLIILLAVCAGTGYLIWICNKMFASTDFKEDNKEY